MADYPYRLNIKICTASEAAAVTEGGTPAVVSDGPERLRFRRLLGRGLALLPAIRRHAGDHRGRERDELRNQHAGADTSHDQELPGHRDGGGRYLAQCCGCGAVHPAAFPAVTKSRRSIRRLAIPTLVTEDYANNQLIVQKAGRYLLTFGRTYLTGTNNVLWTVMVYVNGVEQPHARRQVNVANVSSPNYAELCTIINANAGDTVDIRLWHDSASAVDITYTYAELSSSI